VRALLDVNVLIALLDAVHVHHRTASEWLASSIAGGWASCPLTQNGCVRVMSATSYPRCQPVGAVASRLATATATEFHTFWPDDISVLDGRLFDQSRWLSSRQVTDAYLLALAVKNGGMLVTLDRGLDLRLVRGAEPRHLTVL